MSFFSKYKWLLIIFGTVLGYYITKTEPKKRLSSANRKRKIWYRFDVKRGMPKREAWRKSLYYANKKNFNKYRFNVQPKNYKR